MRFEEAKPGEGFPGMDLSVSSDSFDPDSHFLFWKPGNRPYEEPDGMAWKLDPGDDLVLNIHLQPSGKPEEELPADWLVFHRPCANEAPHAHPARARSSAWTSRLETLILKSATTSACRLTSTFWPSIRMRTISESCSKAMQLYPMESANG